MIGYDAKSYLIIDVTRWVNDTSWYYHLLIDETSSCERPDMTVSRRSLYGLSAVVSSHVSFRLRMCASLPRILSATLSKSLVLLDIRAGAVFHSHADQ